MEVNFANKKSFTVIGKLRSSNDGPNFINEAWKDLDYHFNEIRSLAKVDENGVVVGIWGAMSSLDNSFGIWENNYSEGLYLAGIEVEDDVETPSGWTKWKIPEFNYAYVKVNNNYSEVFRYVVGEFIPNNHLQLAGAIQEFYDPKDNMQLYLFFPVL